MPTNRQFGQNLGRSFGNVGDFVANLILQNKQKEKDKRNKLETQKAENAKINALLTGQMPRVTGGFEGVPFIGSRNITPEERANLLIGLPEGGITKFNAIQKILNPKVEPDKYSNYQFDKPVVTAFNETKGRFEEIAPNPYYSPKVTDTTTGYNAKGEKVIKNFFDDGTVREVPTGFYKDDQYKETGEKFDPLTYAKSTRFYTQKVSELNNLKAKIAAKNFESPQESEAAKNKVNTEADVYAREIYFNLDKTTQNLIDDIDKKLQNSNMQASEIIKRYENTILNGFINMEFDKSLKGTKYKDSVPEVIANFLNYIRLKYGKVK